MGKKAEKNWYYYDKIKTEKKKQPFDKPKILSCNETKFSVLDIKWNENETYLLT